MSLSVEQLSAEFARIVEPAPPPAAAEPAAPAPAAPAVKEAAPGSAPVVGTDSPTAAGPTPSEKSLSAEPGKTDPSARPAPKAPTPASPPPAPIQATDFSAKGFHLDVTVAPKRVVVAAEILDRHGFALDAVSGVDWLAQDQMEVVYDYCHFTEPLRVVVRTRVPRAAPGVPTISRVYPGANWHERETHDFFGIDFAGHPNLSPFLLPEDADFHPLRKDYQP